MSRRTGRSRACGAGRSRAVLRRGFVMPMVVIFALVAGIMCAVLLERQSGQTLAVERQIDAYRGRHFERGVREVVGQWAQGLDAESIQKMAGEDGHTLDIETADGLVLSVYIFDGQGAALSEPVGLGGTQKEHLGSMLRALGEMSGWEPEPSWLRPVGPLAVSAMSAPAEVLEAAALAAVARNPRRFVEAIVSGRADGELTDAEFGTAKNQGDLTPDRLQVLEQLVTNKPTLLVAVVDVYPPGAAEPVARFGGRFDLGSGLASAGGLVQGLGSFLSWEELPIRE